MSYTNGLDDPTAYFQTKTYTGNGSTQDITFDGNSNLQPDFLWLKGRSLAEGHTLQNSVSGVTKHLHSQNTDAEVTDTGIVTAFNSNGFSLADEGDVNGSGSTFVGWSWKASGSTASNSNGSITSSVSANTTAGFSIVSYTGTGSNATVGHGLTSAPELIITKSRSTTGDWKVHTSAIDGSWDVGTLNSTAAFGNSSYTASTSSIFYVGSGAPTNASGVTYVSYLLHSVKAYSKCGSFVGNGSNDGVFCFLGFKPAMVIYKKSSGSENWFIHDNKRQGFNPDNELLFPDLSNAEGTVNRIDLLSNGFKARTSDGGINGSGAKYIFMAFAESPLVTSTGIPCTAR